MAIVKTEIRPKKPDGTYSDVLYPRTGMDMVDGLTEVVNKLQEPCVIPQGADVPVAQRSSNKLYFKVK